MRTLLCLLLFSLGIIAAEAPKTGAYSETFTERGPFSTPEVFLPRYGIKPEPALIAHYKAALAKEPFDIYVPKGYDGSQAYGVISYTSPGDGGGCGYPRLMDKYRLIWIGAAKVNNDRNSKERWMLNLDGVFYMQQRYRIDPKRIYVSGFSGGGRCASRVAPVFPDLYTGAIYICGCNPPQQAEMSTGAALFAQAKSHRYAFITGTTDMNLEDTKGVMKQYQSQGFTQVTYLEQPGMGHGMPNDEYFEKAIMFCDQPLVEAADLRLKEAAALEAKKPAEAWRKCIQVLEDYPAALEATAKALDKANSLAEAAEAALRGDLEKLVKEGKADKLRTFANSYGRLPCGVAAKVTADDLAGKDLDQAVTTGGSGLKAKLEKFIASWAGFPVQARAQAAYDKLASAALAPSLAMPEGAKRCKALAKILATWQGCPAVQAAWQALDDDLAKQLAAIQGIEGSGKRFAALQAFAQEWSARPAGSEAQAACKALIEAAQAGKTQGK